ncbi:hypothetical protein [Pseudoalteromonas ardens]|uniref:hypothetical protein n=1 Tax=Pseudoalteromonas ardens TaxID=3048490 RepID=UPI0024C372F5|nr:hypothetical protein [Pseudoalteromonas sp. R96]MDK1312889.1 hypothetical protein [Pseudoalteromonas sp. R96]
MKLVNLSTGMVEYDGPVESFLGIDAYRAAGSDAEFQLVFTEAEKRNSLRSEISRHVGDFQTLLGTTADASQVLLYEVAKLCTLLSEAESLEDVRRAAIPINQLLGSLVTDIDNGSVRFPYQHKGTELVINEIKSRATAVTDVLIASQ